MNDRCPSCLHPFNVVGQTGWTRTRHFQGCPRNYEGATRAVQAEARLRQRQDRETRRAGVSTGTLSGQTVVDPGPGPCTLHSYPDAYECPACLHNLGEN